LINQRYKVLTLKGAMTLISNERHDYHKMTSECCIAPPGSLRSPSGTLRGKTKDESFAQNTQLSPMLMLPSQKPLRDISRVCENPKTFRGTSLRSASLVSPQPFGLILTSASLRSATEIQKMKCLKAKALRCAQLNKHKSQDLKVKGTSVPSAR
jgi:hypothetical protein